MRMVMQWWRSRSRRASALCLAIEQVVPLIEFQVCGDDGGGLFAVSLVHELEEGVALLPVHGQVSDFIDDQEIELCEVLEEFGRTFVGQGCVEFVEQVLGSVESSVFSGYEGFAQESHGQAGLADPGWGDEQDVLEAVEELQAREFHDLGF
jgi:hypothetical protein